MVRAILVGWYGLMAENFVLFSSVSPTGLCSVALA